MLKQTAKTRIVTARDLSRSNRSQVQVRGSGIKRAFFALLKYAQTFTAAFATLVFLCGVAHSKPLPSLVPSGWTLEARDKEARTRHFVSPDGRASFTTRQTRANRADLRGDIDRIATQDGEQITYLKRGASWVAVSGYRDGDIFYRKSNLACGGSRWNQVELVYPPDMKRAIRRSRGSRTA
jgi:hypothetical protein